MILKLSVEIKQRSGRCQCMESRSGIFFLRFHVTSVQFKGQSKYTCVEDNYSICNSMYRYSLKKKCGECAETRLIISFLEEGI